jgi:hypothetical protein
MSQRSMLVPGVLIAVPLASASLNIAATSVLTPQAKMLTPQILFDEQFFEYPPPSVFRPVSQ